MVHAQGLPALCIPSYTDSTTAGDLIEAVELEDLFNSGTGTTGSTGYHDLRYSGADRIAKVSAGGTYELTITSGARANEVYAAWIDMDQNATFSPSELLGSWTSVTPSDVGTIAFTLPPAARRGYAALRVRCVYQEPLIDPCAEYAFGETEDYMVLINDGLNCIPEMAYGNLEGDEIRGVQMGSFSFPGNIVDPAPYSDRRDRGLMVSPGVTYNLTVSTGPATGDLVAAWIDWNGDGDWDDAGELVGQGYASSPFQSVLLTLTVPLQAPMGQRTLRVRAWDSGLPPNACTDRWYGETEDYTIGVRYPGFLCYPVAGTTSGGDEIVRTVLLGDTFQAPGRWPFHSVIDTLAQRLVRGASYTMNVLSGTHFPTRYQLWVDANYDGDFNDAGEALSTVLSSSIGESMNLNFTLPPTMAPGMTHLRLRCSDGNTLAPGSCESSLTGEIEDHVVVVEDAMGPCIPYVSRWTQDGHFIDGVQLGSISTSGTGGLRGLAYDDNTSLSSVLTAGTSYDLVLTAGANSVHHFDAFIDLDMNGDLGGPGEHIGHAVTSQPGDQATITFTVPFTSLSGATLLRVRCSASDTIADGCADLVPDGLGETEDYTVQLDNPTGVPIVIVGGFSVQARPDLGSVVVTTSKNGEGQHLRVVNMLGQHVFEGHVTGPTTMIPATNWASGTYVVSLPATATRNSTVVYWP
ncbi:MAG: T9SS type A sorting domain-containing protein [Flavobacteriales bacterium]|nr:T9SS type A sorting domain-containing protein [Flavobacteriales bacterium]